jgi:hypothetical protein
MGEEGDQKVNEHENALEWGGDMENNLLPLKKKFEDLVQKYASEDFGLDLGEWLFGTKEETLKDRIFVDVANALEGSSFDPYQEVDTDWFDPTSLARKLSRVIFDCFHEKGADSEEVLSEIKAVLDEAEETEASEEMND